MKIYLAGPMRGQPELNRPAFAKYAADLRAEGHTVFSPAEHDSEADEAVFASLEHSRRAFAVEMNWICLDADAVAVMPGWERSKGALAERALGKALGLKIIYL